MRKQPNTRYYQIKDIIPSEYYPQYYKFLYEQNFDNIKGFLLFIILPYLLYCLPSYYIIPDRFVFDIIGRIIISMIFFCVLWVCFVSSDTKISSKIKLPKIVQLDIFIAFSCIFSCSSWLFNVHMSDMFHIPAFLLSSITYALVANLLIISDFKSTLLATLYIFVASTFVLLATYDDMVNAIIIALFILAPVMIFGLVFAWQNIQQHKRQFLYYQKAEHEKSLLATDNAHLKVQSETDTLTNISNRRAFETKYNQILFQQSDNLQLAVFIIDIDFFKLYNDFYGHFEGDKVLVLVATTLQEIAKENDAYAYRFGGEEFVFVQHYQNLAAVYQLAQLITSSIAKLNICHASRTDDIPYVSISLGCCVYDSKTHKTIIDMLTASDLKLYTVKNSGRNGFLI